MQMLFKILTIVAIALTHSLNMYCLGNTCEGPEAGWTLYFWGPVLFFATLIGCLLSIYLLYYFVSRKQKIFFIINLISILGLCCSILFDVIKPHVITALDELIKIEREYKKMNEQKKIDEYKKMSEPLAQKARAFAAILQEYYEDHPEKFHLEKRTDDQNNIVRESEYVDNIDDFDEFCASNKNCSNLSIYTELASFTDKQRSFYHVGIDINRDGKIEYKWPDNHQITHCLKQHIGVRYSGQRGMVIGLEFSPD